MKAKEKEINNPNDIDPYDGIRKGICYENEYGIDDDILKEIFPDESRMRRKETC